MCAVYSECDHHSHPHPHRPTTSLSLAPLSPSLSHSLSIAWLVPRTLPLPHTQRPTHVTRSTTHSLTPSSLLPLRTPAMRTPLSLLLALAFALASLSLADAKKTGNVLTTNDKQAAGLQAAAVRLKPGNYVFQNVQTKQKLFYTTKKNNIYPSKQGTVGSVTAYPNNGVAWHRLEFGPKNKCLSSAWGSKGNNAAVMYVCASGEGSKKTTLEKTKQWWIFVPTSKPIASAPANSKANQVLLAAQADSIATRKKKIAAQQAAFHKRSTGHGLVKEVRRRALERRGIKTVSGGTFYIIPTDHLLDRTAALTGKSVTQRGIKNTVVMDWKNGNRLQQWKVTRVK
ncbi:hypothetical protein RTBOTA2_006502 [Rhodotorula toruloides]|nr:hypothetical protein RTBOTA2_006502 [Rhodotorula toruloides]